MLLATSDIVDKFNSMSSQLDSTGLKVHDLTINQNSLQNELNLVQQNVNSNLSLTWSVLAVVVAIAGVALYFLSKVLVESAVKAKLNELKANIASDVIAEIKSSVTYGRVFMQPNQTAHCSFPNRFAGGPKFFSAIGIGSEKIDVHVTNVTEIGFDLALSTTGVVLEKGIEVWYIAF